MRLTRQSLITVFILGIVYFSDSCATTTNIRNNKLDFTNLTAWSEPISIPPSERYSADDQSRPMRSDIRTINDSFSGTPQTSSDDSESSSKIDHPPFRRRIPAAIFGFISGFYIYTRGLRCGYKGRRTLGYAIAGLGALINLSSIGLWLSSGFSWSWGWWI